MRVTRKIIEDIDVKPCFNCGETKHVSLSTRNGAVTSYMHCSDCGCDGPSVPDEYGAVKFWNLLYDDQVSVLHKLKILNS